jgi:acetyl esterase/lipase
MTATTICTLLVGFAVPPSGPTYKEVLVATVQDAGKPFPLRTNIYLPRGAATAPTPLVLFIHGNGGAYNFSNGSRAYEFSIALAERGVAVATIDYRPDDALPGEIHDVKAYVRWFRAKAKDGAVGLDIEAASSEWLLRKLLVELAPRK